MTSIRAYSECDRYRFDEEKAERPIRFVEAFARHWEGAFAGQPFLLLDWQKQLIRTLYGWIERATGLRRFRELYLLTAKGAGKTPLIAALGLYMLLADDEPGAHVVSLASNFEQARLTFDAAKNFISEHPQLRKHPQIVPQQYQIKAPQHSKWTTVSGKPTGRSGYRPSCIIADEAHEWPHQTGQAFDLLCANLFKRRQPLLLVATNAGDSQQSYGYQLHSRAVAVREGTLDDPTLLPVIFEADADLDWRSEEAAKAANPSLGEIVPFVALKPEQGKGEARYRRLYLSQWVQSADKWLDLDQWDRCVGDFGPADIEGLPCYVGVDLSLTDDLSAVVWVWVSEARFYVRSPLFGSRPRPPRATKSVTDFRSGRGRRKVTSRWLTSRPYPRQFTVRLRRGYSRKRRATSYAPSATTRPTRANALRHWRPRT